jgi:hypothetical protein
MRLRASWDLISSEFSERQDQKWQKIIRKVGRRRHNKSSKFNIFSKTLKFNASSTVLKALEESFLMICSLFHGTQFLQSYNLNKLNG